MNILFVPACFEIFLKVVCRIFPFESSEFFNTFFSSDVSFVFGNNSDSFFVILSEFFKDFLKEIVIFSSIAILVFISYENAISFIWFNLS